MAMKTKRFRVGFVVAVELDVSEKLIEEVMKPDWQKSFYTFTRPEDVAVHLAYNVARNHATLQSLDGFAHLGSGHLKVVDEDWSEAAAVVVKQKPGRKKKSS